MPIRPRRETGWRIGFFYGIEKNGMDLSNAVHYQRRRLSREHGDLVYSATKLKAQRYACLAVAIGDRVLGF